MLSPIGSCFPRSPARVLLVVLLFFVLRQLLHFRSPGQPVRLSEHSVQDDDRLNCEGLEGLKDIFVLLRTGTTEAPKKLPAHFATTLRCVPNYAIYSDFEEDIAGHHIYNALDEIDPEIRASHPDFEYYNRLQGKGREAFTAEEIAQWSSAKNTMGGRDSPGWRLDKWKFLPLADKGYRANPRAKWYIFVESDTFILWKTLLEWLSKYDASKPYYLGQQMQIGDVVFAYGGAGFAVSNPAMKKVVEHRSANLKFYDDFTAGHWAGDCVLGKALLDAGVNLHWSYPTLSGDEPADTDFDSGFGGPERKPWCYYAASYHHLPPSEFATFSEFERRWNNENTTLMRHYDIFRNYIQPRLRSERSDWDNLSEKEQTSESSFKACRDACQSQQDCLQFSVSGYSCKTSTALKLGHKSSAEEQVASGWMLDRIEDFTKRMDAACVDRDWIMP
ncbi:Uu.00g076270.m01.CDS01 [Anthostomella pinea]|uniref:N-acetylgalactosaminide beta-1,3-galactosyltransferase n=1 Tax=Anthostomella pinea TaxID=933095 RepID=A0AAI8YLU0_9PEZI|nr:Uu.00g076270.m01.CDS01 [Anthostomella pinea]